MWYEGRGRCAMRGGGRCGMRGGEGVAGGCMCINLFLVKYFRCEGVKQCPSLALTLFPFTYFSSSPSPSPPSFLLLIRLPPFHVA